MFFNEISKRKFCSKLATMFFATLIAPNRALAQLTAHFDSIQVNGNVVTLVTTFSPTNTVLGLQKSTDGIRWIDVPPANIISQVLLAPGHMEWKIYKTGERTFYRLKLESAIIMVGTMTYQIPVNGQNLFAVMTTLESSTAMFTFESQSMTLGQFVTKINGAKAQWVFTVNGKQWLSSGVSSYVPNGQDVIAWFQTS